MLVDKVETESEIKGRTTFVHIIIDSNFDITHVGNLEYCENNGISNTCIVEDGNAESIRLCGSTFTEKCLANTIFPFFPFLCFSPPFFNILITLIYPSCTR